MKLIVSAHGMLAKEVVNSAGMVFGAIDDLDIVTFVPGENAETLKARYKELIDGYKEDEEIGVPIKSVNIGGMAFKTGKTQITKAVSVDESDIAAFKKLHEMGIELEIRPVATDKKVDLMSKIEGIEG